MTDYMDIFIGVAFHVLFLIFATRKCKTWLTADMIFTALMGICLLLEPGASIKMETTGLKVHALHRFFNRLFGSMLLGPLLIWYRCRKTSDETVLGSMLWSRVVGGLPLVIFITYGHMTHSFFVEKVGQKMLLLRHLTPIFRKNQALYGSQYNWWRKNLEKPQLEPPTHRKLMSSYLMHSHWPCWRLKLIQTEHFWFGILGNFLWWLASVVQLLKTRPCMGRQQTPGSLNPILNVWFLIDFVGSLALMAYPDRLLTFQTMHVDKHSMHTCRAVGALLLGTTIFNWYTPSYLSDTDRKTVFISGIATILLVILSTVVGYHVDGLQFSKEQLLHVVGAVLVKLCPLLFGLYLIKPNITTDTKATDSWVYHICSRNKEASST